MSDLDEDSILHSLKSVARTSKS